MSNRLPIVSNKLPTPGKPAGLDRQRLAQVAARRNPKHMRRSPKESRRPAGGSSTSITTREKIVTLVLVILAFLGLCRILYYIEQRQRDRDLWRQISHFPPDIAKVFWTSYWQNHR